MAGPEHSVRIWFIGAEDDSDFRPASFNVVPKEFAAKFIEAANLRIVALSLAAAQSKADDAGLFQIEILRPLVEKIGNFLSRTELPDPQRAVLGLAAGSAYQALSAQTGLVSDAKAGSEYLEAALTIARQTPFQNEYSQIGPRLAAEYCELADLTLNLSYLDRA